MSSGEWEHSHFQVAGKLPGVDCSFSLCMHIYMAKALRIFINWLLCFAINHYLFRHSYWFIKTHVQIFWWTWYENTDEIGRSKRICFIYKFCINTENGRWDKYSNKVATKLFSLITYQTSFIFENIQRKLKAMQAAGWISPGGFEWDCRPLLNFTLGNKSMHYLLESNIFSGWNKAYLVNYYFCF